MRSTLGNNKKKLFSDVVINIVGREDEFFFVKGGFA